MFINMKAQWDVSWDEVDLMIFRGLLTKRQQPGWIMGGGSMRMVRYFTKLYGEVFWQVIEWKALGLSSKVVGEVFGMEIVGIFGEECDMTVGFKTRRAG